MDRRHFLRQSALAGGTLLGAARASNLQAAPLLSDDTPPSFHLNYAPHLGMFESHAGSDPVDQIAFMAEQGFTAFEDNGMRGRSRTEQTRIANALGEHDMQMGVFVAHSINWQEPGLTTGKKEPRQKFLDEIRGSVEVAQRVDATWMTVVPGARDLRLDPGFQRANVIEALREAVAILEPHDLVMVLEPLNNRRDHPNQFLTRTAQAYEICRAVDSSACKILYDVYHQQITEGNLIPNLDAAWEEIAYVQVGDNPGRNEPTTGEINFWNVFEHLYEKGYEGVVGMEHGVSGKGKAGEKAVIEAYRSCDSFEAL
ncbi:MAG: hydroxypyruvate isomerase family protein [Salinibacter sp.]